MTKLFWKRIQRPLNRVCKIKETLKKSFFKSLTTVRSPFDLALHFNSVRAEGRSKTLRVIEVIKENNIKARAGKIRVFKVKT